MTNSCFLLNVVVAVVFIVIVVVAVSSFLVQFDFFGLVLSCVFLLLFSLRIF